MNLSVQPETHIPKIYQKLRIKLQKSREDTKLSTIRSISWKNRSRLRRWLWLKNILNIRRRIKLCWNIVVNLRRKRRKWILRDKWSKIFPTKFQNCTQVSGLFRLRGSTKKMSMSWFWRKEIFLEPNSSEETMSQLFSMKRSRSNRPLWQGEKQPSDKECLT